MSEKKQFQAESQRLLDLMINSIYTNKEIFLRELISNASDALDKLSYLILTNGNTTLKKDDLQIMLTLDKTRRLLVVSDNGIGMSEEELENNLGIIANSGSLKFKQDTVDNDTATDIIGQFGVGFYSAFMVADDITVISRKYGEETAHRWRSSGVDGYTIEPCSKRSHGTDIIMHIRPDGEDKDAFSQYMREYPLWKLVKKYSDYIRYPIRILMPHPKPKPGSTPENPEFEEVYEYETINSMVPIWQRNKSEITKDEYDQFYQEHFLDPMPPQICIPLSVEGNISYKALLYIPSGAPKKAELEDTKPGLQLYSSGVLIMEHCEALLPRYFQFVKGIVDSPDLSLNISREMLQHDRQLTVIASNLEKKLRWELEKMRDNDRDNYTKFFHIFGRQLKLGCIDNYGENKEKLQDLLLFHTSLEKGECTLKEYVGRMPAEQTSIYYASGNTVEAIDRLPQTELLKTKQYEILYFIDKTDEFLADTLKSYKEKPFCSVIDGDLKLSNTGSPRRGIAYRDTLKFVKDVLGDSVDDVIASEKLVTHPVCLSSGSGITFEMEKYYKAVHPERNLKAKRVLEINVDHPAFTALEKARLMHPEKARKYSQILLNQALLIAGIPLENPSDYTDLLCSLW